MDVENTLMLQQEHQHSSLGGTGLLAEGRALSGGYSQQVMKNVHLNLDLSARALKKGFFN